MDIKKHSKKIIVFTISLLAVISIVLGIKKWSNGNNASPEGEMAYPAVEGVSNAQSGMAAMQEAGPDDADQSAAKSVDFPVAAEIPVAAPAVSAAPVPAPKPAPVPAKDVAADKKPSKSPAPDKKTKTS